MAELVQKLIQTNYLPQRNVEAIETYSTEIATAVEQIQEEYQLPKTAVFDGKVLKVLRLLLYRQEHPDQVIFGQRPLKRGDEGADVQILRRVLEHSSMLKRANPKRDLLFDESVEDAVKKFQAYRGLEQTGIVAQYTLILLEEVWISGKVTL